MIGTPTKLKEICRLRTGKLDSNAAVPNGEFPFFTCAQETYRIDSAAFDTEAVLLGGNNAAGIYPLKYYNGPFNAYQRTYVIESLNKETLSTRFLYYSLSQALSRFQSASIGAATQYLTKSILDNFEVLLPSIDAQNDIAAVLSYYDDLIENNRRRIALLQEAARLLYQEWFVHLRFPGHEYTPVVDGIPEGWQDCRIRDLGAVITGKTPSTKESDNYGDEIPFIKTPDMHGNVFVLQTETSLTEKGANTQPGKFIPANTLLVSCIGTIGVVSLTSTRSQFNQQINAVVPFEDPSRYYCYFAFKELKEEMEAIGGGATMGNVNKTKFEGLKVLKPSLTLLHEFHDTCAPMFEQIQVLSRQNLKLREARDLLLPRLMSGEIEV